MSRVVRFVLILLACLLTASPAHGAVGGTPDADPPVTDRPVETIVRDGSTLYLGGDFTYVGRRTSLARLGADGRSTGSFPRVTDGGVEALLDDGNGGWYVGGSFDTIGGADVPRLAHVLADGSVDPAFRPAPDGEVRALALAGGVLYAGGDFDAPRRNLMLLDPAGGTVLPDAPDPDGAVEALAANGGEVLVGGRFDAIGGVARRHVAALAGGIATSFNPDLDGTVRAIAVEGADIYLGGSFRHVGIALPQAARGGGRRGRAYELDRQRRRHGTRPCRRRLPRLRGGLVRHAERRRRARLRQARPRQRRRAGRASRE
jgi:hypothetical protein